MGKSELVNVQNLNESLVPTLIQEQFGHLKVLKQNVELAIKKAELAHESAISAKSKSIGLFQKKEAIESLQDAAVDLADAQISQSEAQELSFEYQQKLGEITKYLFGLGVTNIAVNRSVVRELEMRLRGASEEELDEFSRQEIIGVVKQLKAQQDIVNKQNELTERVKQHENKFVWQEEKQIELQRLFKEKAEHDKKQDEILEKHSEKEKEHDTIFENSKKKEEEHDRLLADITKKDINQDTEIALQAAKVEELSRRINECVEKDKDQDVEIARQAGRDEELSRLLNELMQSNLIEEAEIRELMSKCEDLTKQIASGSEYVESVEGSIVHKLNEKASKKGLIISYIIGVVALIVSIIQFFV